VNPWPLVLADFRTNRAGAVAIVLLVALAVALGVAVSAQERALREGSARAASPFPLLVGAPGSETQLVLSAVYLQPAALDLVPGAVLDALAREPSARLVSPLGFGDNYRGHPVVGVAPALVEHLAGPAGRVEGRPFARLDEAVVGASVPASLGDELVPAHGLVETGEDERHDGVAYRVVGRLPPLGSPWDGAVVVPIEAVWAAHAMPDGHAPGGPGADPDAGPVGPPWDPAELSGAPAVVVVPASFATAYDLRQRYRARPDTTAVFPAEVLVRLHALLGDVRDLLAAVSLVTQVLVIGASLLAVLASLAQRRRQIAVLRALGASRGYVFATVWLGVALTLAAAGALGLGLGYLVAVVLSRLFAAETGVRLGVALSGQEAGLVAAVVGIGLLLATVPAALAYRGSVGAALRG
jgi:putative ABC transport system permease protein